MIPFSILFVFLQLLINTLAFDIKGRLDVSPSTLPPYGTTRTHFKLYQLSAKKEDLYSDKACIKNIEGDFVFRNVPVELDINKKTYFTLHTSSLDYNLKPNRILIEVIGNGPDELPTLNAYENFFGREYFPSAEILHPETLKTISVDPYIRISLMNKQPLRSYITTRNQGLLRSGPIASILNSKWKLAGVITMIFMIVFPMVLEKIDPETARAIKEEKMKRESEKYLKKN